MPQQAGRVDEALPHDSVAPTPPVTSLDSLGRAYSAIMRLLSAVAPLGRFIPQVEAPSGGKRVQFK